MMRARLTALVCLLAPAAGAQVTRADYERAFGLRDRYQYATTGVAETPAWIGETGSPAVP